jgi:hypothetical protein
MKKSIIKFFRILGCLTAVAIFKFFSVTYAQDNLLLSKKLNCSQFKISSPVQHRKCIQYSWSNSNNSYFCPQSEILENKNETPICQIIHKARKASCDFYNRHEFDDSEDLISQRKENYNHCRQVENLILNKPQNCVDSSVCFELKEMLSYPYEKSCFDLPVHQQGACFGIRIAQKLYPYDDLTFDGKFDFEIAKDSPQNQQICLYCKSQDCEEDLLRYNWNKTPVGLDEIFKIYKKLYIYFKLQIIKADQGIDKVSPFIWNKLDQKTGDFDSTATLLLNNLKKYNREKNKNEYFFQLLNKNFKEFNQLILFRYKLENIHSYPELKKKMRIGEIYNAKIENDQLQRENLGQFEELKEIYDLDHQPFDD